MAWFYAVEPNDQQPSVRQMYNRTRRVTTGRVFHVNVVVYSEVVQSYIVSCKDFHPMIGGMSSSFAHEYLVRESHEPLTTPDIYNQQGTEGHRYSVHFAPFFRSAHSPVSNANA